MKKLKILVLLSIFFVGSTKRRKHCKGPDQLQWKVENFESIISWNMKRKCASKFSDYTVEMCTIDCEESHGDWIRRTCKRLPAKDDEAKKRLTCAADIDARSGPTIRVCYNSTRTRKHKKCSHHDGRDTEIYLRSTFTAPIFTIAENTSTSFTVNIQEPTEEFLNYFNPFKFKIYVAEITDSSKKITCRNEGTDKPMETSFVKNAIKIVSKENSQNQCRGEYDKCLWKVQGLKPETSYCVFGNYGTDDSEDMHISDTGYKVVKTLKKGVSSSFVVLLIITSVIFVSVSSIAFITTRRWIKSTKTIEGNFLSEMQKSYDWNDNLSDSIFLPRSEVLDVYDPDSFACQARLENVTAKNRNDINVAHEQRITREYILEFGYNSSESSTTNTAETESSISCYVQKKENENDLSCTNSSPKICLLKSSTDDSLTRAISECKGEELPTSPVTDSQCSRKQWEDRSSSGIEEDIDISHDGRHVTEYQQRSQFCSEKDMLMQQTRDCLPENTTMAKNDIVEGFSHLPKSNGYMPK